MKKTAAIEKAKVERGQKYTLRSRETVKTEEVKIKSVELARNSATNRVKKEEEKKELLEVASNSTKEQSEIELAKMEQMIEQNQVNLQQIIQLLNLKIQADEIDRQEPKVSVEGFSKVVPDFDGESVPVEYWFNNFELNADAYGLNEKQKYVNARSKMTKTAQLFLESVFVCSYGELKSKLLNEFKREYESAEIHTKLNERKKQDVESFQEYVLQMRKIAALGNVETKSIIRYIVNGLNIAKEFKYNMYGCKTFEELKEKYCDYECVKDVENQKDDNKERKRNQNSDNSKNQSRCFNCGSVDHMRKDCVAKTKCFKCQEDGHISLNCPNTVKAVQVVKADKRLKIIKLNNVEVSCLVDTGADVSIVKFSVYKRLPAVELNKCTSVLRGMGKVSTIPLGEFEGVVTVDDVQSLQKFIVVPDNKIEFDALVGYDFVSKFHFALNENGFNFSSSSAQEDHADLNQMSIYNIVETKVDKNAPPQYKPSIESLKQRSSVRGDASSKERLQLERELQEARQQLQTSIATMSEAQRREQKLQKDLAKLQLEQQQQSSDNKVAMKELQERLEITNTELQHKEQLAREDEQKIADLKTLVETIRVANANLSAKNAELSTVLEVLQAEKNEMMQSFELFEMEADMNAGRLVEKLHGMKQELEQSHSALKLQKSSNKQLQEQLQEVQQTDQNLQGTAVEVAEQLRQLNQSIGELQKTVHQMQYDEKRKQVYDYKEGDLVAVKRTQFLAGRKLHNNYLGPYEVIEVKRNGCFEVRKAAQIEGPNITITSSDNMKLWQYVGYNDDCLSSGTDDAYQDGRM
ncbi:uncharacterized protein LOC117577322 [Drosophila albomicans]|uniref:Uncharacterized protein LOC117577322 n=1 Tax=Drosophila albomicans TaxID=7291 RepID=A0A6P8XNL4_DROAB|nr:uncharacterized protein LOC117577322 [Drosophila albomicans]